MTIRDDVVSASMLTEDLERCPEGTVIRSESRPDLSVMVAMKTAPSAWELVGHQNVFTSSLLIRLRPTWHVVARVHL